MTTGALIRTTVAISWASMRPIHRIALLQGEAFSAMPGMHSPASFASVTVSVISPRQRQFCGGGHKHCSTDTLKAANSRKHQIAVLTMARDVASYCHS